jgi:hypothetical protein
VRLPDGWKTVRAAQGETPVDVSLVEHAGCRFGLVQAVPDRGAVALTGRTD